MIICRKLYSTTAYEQAVSPSVSGLDSSIDLINSGVTYVESTPVGNISSVKRKTRLIGDITYPLKYYLRKRRAMRKKDNVLN